MSEETALARYSDLAAIPLFIVLILYCALKKNRTPVETLLLMFGIIGLLVDVALSLHRFARKKRT